MSQTKRLFEECFCKDAKEPTLEEIVKLKLNPERGFYCDIRDGRLHAGRDPGLATTVV